MREQNRKLTYYIGATIDGYIAGPDDQVEDFPLDPDLLEAIKEHWPETIPTHVREPLGVADAPNRGFDAVIMGRGTYDPGLKLGITSPYAHLDQYVVTTTLGADTDPGVTFVGTDPLAFVRDLKAQEGGGIWLAGGGKLAAALIDEIDEIVVKRYRVLIGGGIPMFAGPYRPTAFTLESNRSLESGASIQTYRKA
jgi:dihydrofolate reductase